MQLWAGIDAGKGHHWITVVDESGSTKWSQKVDNDEGTIHDALGQILALAGAVRWAVDIRGTASALLLALLAAHGQHVVYVPGAPSTGWQGRTGARRRLTPATPT